MSFWKPLDWRERIALIISVAATLTAIVYWIVQIQGVREMFKLTHGGG